MRRIMIAGNWKMHTTVCQGVDLVNTIWQSLQDSPLENVEVVVCPPHTHLAIIKPVLANTRFELGAQNMFFEDSGAYTGEVSPLMLREICEYVILGHSERRQYFAETDARVNNKIQAALKHGLKSIVCVGETLEIREQGDYLAYVEKQVRAVFSGVVLTSASQIVMAYEPIWAIGTGRAATAAQGQEVIAMIRRILDELYPRVASDLRILYGGSSSEENIASFLAQDDIDGALVGSASIRAEDFVNMVKIATHT